MHGDIADDIECSPSQVYLLLRPRGRDAKYCDERVCLSVCLSVRLHIIRGWMTSWFPVMARGRRCAEASSRNIQRVRDLAVVYNSSKLRTRGRSLMPTMSLLRPNDFSSVFILEPWDVPKYSTINVRHCSIHEPGMMNVTSFV